MKFWNVFLSLCNEIGKSPNAVAKELGISSGTVTTWKKESSRVPQDRYLLKIADYFNVSVDYLLGNTDIKNEQKEKSPLPNTDKEDVILELFKNLPIEKQKEIIVEYMSKADEETQSRIVQAFISALGNQG